MGMHFITFRSVTPAQRGQRLLQQAGMDPILQRTPRWMEERGCGYCLRLRPEDSAKAVALLRQAGLGFSKIYADKEPGPEELYL
jgi:hypothetical protein